MPRARAWSKARTYCTVAYIRMYARSVHVCTWCEPTESAVLDALWGSTPSDLRNLEPGHACRDGRPQPLSAACNGRNGRRTLVPAAGAARAAYGSVGGVRRALRTRSAAGADAGNPPGGRHLHASRRCDLAGARLEPFGASGGSEAVPGGLGPAWRWPTVAPGPAGVAAAALMRCEGRLMAYVRTYDVFRDLARFYVW